MAVKEPASPVSDPAMAGEPAFPGPDEFDDATLVARAGQGDVDAFGELVVRYQETVYRLALRMMGNSAEAEDVTQDTFLAAWRGVGGLRQEAAFGGWLYRLAVNRCLNLLRRRRPVAEFDPAGLPSARPDEQPEAMAEAGAEVAALAEALQRLTPAQRACWVLRELHGCSYEEIAGIVGASTTAVRGRIARSRALLAEVMQPWR